MKLQEKSQLKKKKRRSNARTVRKRTLNFSDRPLNKTNVNSRSSSRKPEERLKSKREEHAKPGNSLRERQRKKLTERREKLRKLNPKESNRRSKQHRLLQLLPLLKKRRRRQLPLLLKKRMSKFQLNQDFLNSKCQ
jgi:hypothetical protein